VVSKNDRENAMDAVEIVVAGEAELTEMWSASSGPDRTILEAQYPTHILTEQLGLGSFICPGLLLHEVEPHRGYIAELE